MAKKTAAKNSAPKKTTKKKAAKKKSTSLKELKSKASGSAEGALMKGDSLPNPPKNSRGYFRLQKRKEMDVELLRVCDEYEALEKKRNINELESRWKQAQLVYGAKNNPRKYGANALENMCKNQGIGEALKVNLLRVAEFIPEDVYKEVKRLNESVDNFNITFTALITASRFKEKSLILKHLKHLVAERLTTDDFIEYAKKEHKAMRRLEQIEKGEKLTPTVTTAEAKRTLKSFLKVFSTGTMDKVKQIDDKDFFGTVYNMKESDLQQVIERCDEALGVADEYFDEAKNKIDRLREYREKAKDQIASLLSDTGDDEESEEDDEGVFSDGLTQTTIDEFAEEDEAEEDATEEGGDDDGEEVVVAEDEDDQEDSFEGYEEDDDDGEVVTLEDEEDDEEGDEEEGDYEEDAVVAEDDTEDDGEDDVMDFEDDDDDEWPDEELVITDEEEEEDEEAVPAMQIDEEDDSAEESSRSRAARIRGN